MRTLKIINLLNREIIMGKYSWNDIYTTGNQADNVVMGVETKQTGLKDLGSGVKFHFNVDSEEYVLTGVPGAFSRLACIGGAATGGIDMAGNAEREAKEELYYDLIEKSLDKDNTINKKMLFDHLNSNKTDKEESFKFVSQEDGEKIAKNLQELRDNPIYKAMIKASEKDNLNKETTKFAFRTASKIHKNGSTEIDFQRGTFTPETIEITDKNDLKKLFDSLSNIASILNPKFSEIEDESNVIAKKTGEDARTIRDTQIALADYTEFNNIDPKNKDLDKEREGFIAIKLSDVLTVKQEPSSKAYTSITKTNHVSAIGQRGDMTLLLTAKDHESILEAFSNEEQKPSPKVTTNQKAITGLDGTSTHQKK